MAKTRFVTDADLKQIDLGDGDWVKIPSRLSYGFVAGISEGDEKDAVKISTKILVGVIKQWNLKDADGNDVAVTPENIQNLDFSTVQAIMTAVEPMMTPDPKAEAAS